MCENGNWNNGQNGSITTIINDAGDKRDFTFDYSFWSFDGFSTDSEGYNYPD